MRSPARKYPREMQDAGAPLGPPPGPICTEPDCLACNLKRLPTETRSEFIDRLRDLYARRRLF